MDPLAAASSSDDEELNFSDDEADSSSSEEEEQHSEPTPPPSVTAADSSSSDDEEQSSEPTPPPSGKKVSTQAASTYKSQTESRSESDSDVDRSNVSKPTSDAAPAKRIKTRSSSNPSKAASTTFKKVSETDSKTKQSKNKENKVLEKKPQRIWSEEDEIFILEGMIAFRSNNNPVSDFFEFIKKSFHFNPTRPQLMDKQRKLRRKYNKKKKLGGVNIRFSEHALRVYNLSEKIWGANAVPRAKTAAAKNENENNSVSDVTGNMKCINGKRKRKTAAAKNPVSDVNENMKCRIEEYVLNEGMLLLDASKKVELENKWKALQLEFFARQMELITEQSKLVLAARTTNS